MHIPIYSPQEIQKINDAGKIAANTLLYLKEYIKPGTTTLELNVLAVDYIKKQGAISAFYGYKDYPAAICASINEDIVHALPLPNHVLKMGDVIKIDLGVCYNGYYADTAYTYYLTDVQDTPIYKYNSIETLIHVTQNALNCAISICYPGQNLYEISNYIQLYVESYGFNIVKELGGHGIGKSLHEEPFIPNYKTKGKLLLKPGMVLAIEPITLLKPGKIKVKPDNWTIYSENNISAHFEHTIAITDKGAIILTYDK